MAPSTVSLKAIRRTFCHQDKVYIITGGLGGFGLELSQWLIERGATKLLLTSRSGVKTGYQSYRVRQWQEKGVDVHVSLHNIATLEGTRALIEDAKKIAEVGGIFHLATVLIDALFHNLTQKEFQEVGGAKMQGALNLDAVSRKHCSKSLEWFVVFSSGSAGFGNAGQTSYGFANSSMERLCELRTQDGIHGKFVLMFLSSKILPYVSSTGLASIAEGSNAGVPYTRFLNTTATRLPCRNETSYSRVQSLSRMSNTTALKSLKLL